MAIKPTIHEICPKCGQRNARIDEAAPAWFWVGHNCPEDPPGPHEPPMRLHEEEIDFVPERYRNWGTKEA